MLSQRAERTSFGVISGESEESEGVLMMFWIQLDCEFPDERSSRRKGHHQERSGLEVGLRFDLGQG